MTQISEEPDSKNDPRTYRIIGAAIEVHQQLGPGFLEGVYQEALAIEFDRRGICHRPQVELPIWYKQQQLASSYRADFVCFESVVVERKAQRSLAGIEEAQVINYLKATGLKVGLLLNFGSPWLKHKRLVRNF